MVTIIYNSLIGNIRRIACVRSSIFYRFFIEFLDEGPPRLGDIFRGRVLSYSSEYHTGYLDIGSEKPILIQGDHSVQLKMGQIKIVEIIREGRGTKNSVGKIIHSEAASLAASLQPNRKLGLVHSQSKIDFLIRNHPGEKIKIISDQPTETDLWRSYFHNLSLVEYETYSGFVSLFEAAGLSDLIKQLFLSRFYFSASSHVSFSQTDAGMMIDVNHNNSFLGRSSIKNTIPSINRKSLKVILQQIALRNLSGTFFIDCIDSGFGGIRYTDFIKKASDPFNLNLTIYPVLGMNRWILLTRKHCGASLIDQLTTFCECCSQAVTQKPIDLIFIEIYDDFLSFCSKNKSSKNNSVKIYLSKHFIHHQSRTSSYVLSLLKSLPDQRITIEYLDTLKGFEYKFFV